MKVELLDEMIRELVAARQRRALSQRRLSVRLGLTELVVGRWECRIDVPSTEHFVAWARVLGLGVVLLDPAGKPIEQRPDLLPGESFEHFEVRRITLALKATRMDADFAQKALGRELGVSTRAILMWETARREPRLKHLLAWADRLSCRITLEPTRPDGAAREI